MRETFPGGEYSEFSDGTNAREAGEGPDLTDAILHAREAEITPGETPASSSGLNRSEYGPD